jgi:hypothetical protein
MSNNGGQRGENTEEGNKRIRDKLKERRLKERERGEFIAIQFKIYMTIPQHTMTVEISLSLMLTTMCVSLSHHFALTYVLCLALSLLLHIKPRTCYDNLLMKLSPYTQVYVAGHCER